MKKLNPNPVPAIRTLIDSMLSRRVQNTSSEGLSGFKPGGKGTIQSICGDCDD
jgi:hypothetical protein